MYAHARERACLIWGGRLRFAVSREKGGREMVGMASEPAYFMLQLCI